LTTGYGDAAIFNLSALLLFAEVLKCFDDP
jgi:hypothetical protein